MECKLKRALFLGTTVGLMLGYPFHTTLRRIAELTPQDFQQKVLMGNYRRALIYQHYNYPIATSLKGFWTYYRNNAIGFGLSIYIAFKLGMFKNWQSHYQQYPYTTNEKLFNYLE